jgi:hypothetical protein
MSWAIVGRLWAACAVAGMVAAVLADRLLKRET